MKNGETQNLYLLHWHTFARIIMRMLFQYNSAAGMMRFLAEYSYKPIIN